MTMPSLQGKVAIVTGAAMGMGAATAKLFAEAGANVVVSDINQELGEAVVVEIRRSGGVACFQRTDVSKAADVKSLVERAVSEYGALHVAVNNAAVSPDTHVIWELDEAEWDRVIAVDLKSVALCLKYQTAQMLRQNIKGSIVNIASCSAYRPQPANSAYVAAKHGVVGLTKTAALDCAPHMIRVNAVAPGAIETPMLRSSIELLGLKDEDLTPVFTLFNRFGKAVEVAHASLWLASDLSSYVTGMTLPVDGGFINR
jgi:NAD(P)-dependent dehydrogenase (short-subunit alcohol dehydrogenase family)